MNFKKAFSLGEVLTTLAVIGVVAALTVPVLNTAVQQNKTLSMFEKFYAAFSVDIETVLNQASCSSISCLRAYDDDDPGVDDNDGKHNGIFANPKYFNIDSECMDCFRTGELLPEMIQYQPADDGNEEIDSNFTVYRLVNGANVAIYDYDDNCTTNLDTVTNNGNEIDLCGAVILDVNGEKGPNAPGEDRFAFYIIDEPIGDYGFILPVGLTPQDGDENKITSMVFDEELFPFNRTAAIIENGWKWTDIALNGYEIKDKDGNITSELKKNDDGSWEYSHNDYSLGDGTYTKKTNKYSKDNKIQSEEEYQMNGSKIVSGTIVHYDGSGKFSYKEKINESGAKTCYNVSGSLITCP